MTFVEFIASANKHYEDNKSDLRYGQAVFNHLLEVRPDIAEAIRATELDTFHKSSVSDDTWLFIHLRWT